MSQQSMFMTYPLFTKEMFERITLQEQIVLFAAHLLFLLDDTSDFTPTCKLGKIVYTRKWKKFLKARR